MTTLSAWERGWHEDEGECEYVLPCIGGIAAYAGDPQVDAGMRSVGGNGPCGRVGPSRGRREAETGSKPKGWRPVKAKVKQATVNLTDAD